MLPDNLLHQDLSRKIEEVAVNVRKQYGSGQKEKLYQRAFEEELQYQKIPHKRECPIVIYSFRTGKVLGKYIPDFIIDDKIIVEIKAVGYIPKNIENQLLDYLKNGKYELGYIINFSGRSLYRRRFICTNNRKDFINH